MSQSHTPLEHSGRPSKVAIPRLDRYSQPFSRSGNGNRHRVQRACLSCRARKIKCNGAQPRCQNCESNLSPCVYASSRKDRLKIATDHNQDMIQLLRGLKSRVSMDDRKMIEDILHGVVDDAVDAASQAPKSPEKSNAGNQADERGEANVSAEVGSNEDLDMVDEDLLRNESARATGFIGKNSEIQWIRRLHHTADHVTDSAKEREGPYGPPGESVEADVLRRNAHKRRKEKQRSPLMQTSSCNYFLDDETVEMDFMVDPFELPPFEIAERLLKSYMETVQKFYPFLAKKTFVGQFWHYYAAVARGKPYQLPQQWQAMLNLVFAIGAIYSHCIDAEWQADERDHLIYHARAWNLGIKDPWWFTHPSLTQLQVTALISFYYLAIGHINRSWVVIGMTLRFGYSLGLHVRNEDPAATLVKKEVMARIWWGIYSLERTLCLITGRPSVGIQEVCSVPMPLPLSTQEIEEAVIESRFGSEKGLDNSSSTIPASGSKIFTNMPALANEPTNSGSFLKHLVKLGSITQRTLTELYSAKVVTESWETVQKIILNLSEELEAWLSALPPGFDFSRLNYDMINQRERSALEINYYSAKILLTRPCLCRLDRRIEKQTRSSSDFNQRTARASVFAAESLANLLPEVPEQSPAQIYTLGPWWSMVHFIMQALVILLLEIYYDSGDDDHQTMTISLKKLMSSLKVMAANNGIAKRAHNIAIDILRKLRTTGPQMQKLDISNLLDENTSEASNPHSTSSPFGSSSRSAAPGQDFATLNHSYNQRLNDFLPSQTPIGTSTGFWPSQGEQSGPTDLLFQDRFNTSLSPSSAFPNIFITNFDENNPLPFTLGDPEMIDTSEQPPSSWE